MKTDKLKNVRVLQVVSSLGMGGAETWLVQLLRYLKSHQDNSLDMDFLITSGAESVFDKEVRSLGAKTHYIPLRKGTSVSFAKGLRKVLKENDYCAIHDHQDFLSGWHFLFGIGRLPPVRIAHVHNPSYQLLENYGKTLNRRLKLRMGKSLLRMLATHIGGTSKQVLGEYGITSETFPRQWVDSLHCAFPLETWQGDHNLAKMCMCREIGWPFDCKLILFAGRLDYSLEVDHPQNHKNSVFALNVFSALHDKRNVRMVMAGANDYIKDEFQRLIDSKGLSDHVRLLGVRKDMTQLMLASDVLLFPSRAEGLGMVAVEAQAAGLPVLASTAVPKECVVLDELVRFCDLGDPVDVWVDEMNQIFSKKRPESKSSDPRWVKSDFNIRMCSKKLSKLYIEV